MASILHNFKQILPDQRFTAGNGDHNILRVEIPANLPKNPYYFNCRQLAGKCFPTGTAAAMFAEKVAIHSTFPKEVR